MRFLVLSALLALSLFADSISSFTADKDTGKPNDVVNLDINYVATKKYELHFTAYKNNDGTELSPDFSATDLKNIAYTIPDEADYDIKIVAELVEDGSVVDNKDVVVEINSLVKGLYFCQYGSCFEPEPNVTYQLIHGDDPGALIFLRNANADFYYSSATYNAVALGNAIIHYYNLNTNNISRGDGWSCYSGCCNSTTWGTDSTRDCLNSRDTEDRIFATYQPEYSRIKIKFIGGYYSCSCGRTNCCGGNRTNIGYVYLLPK